MTRGIAAVLGCICGFALFQSIPAVAGEPRTLYDTPLYPGDIVEPRLRELLPSDAAEYAGLYRACLHWSGEPAYNEERGEEIARGIEASCNGLDAARDSLRLKYRPGSSFDSTLHRVIADLASSSDQYVWDDPRHESIVLNRYYETCAQRAGKRVDELIAQRRTLGHRVDEATRNMLRVMTTTQTRALGELIENIDRLHPETAEEVRAARVRWERETEEKVR